MAEAEFRHGNPIMIDYTAAAAITAGQVLVGGNTTGPASLVAHKDIANGDTDAMAAGGGVYDVTVASNYAAYTKVYWDDSGANLTTTSTNNWLFGYTVEASAAANSVVKVLHWPMP